MQGSRESQGEIRRPSQRVQCKETEENKRVGKTKDLFKKIEDIEGTFHAKMDTVKNRSGKDLTEAEEIKKTSQEYTELD